MTKVDYLASLRERLDVLDELEINMSNDRFRVNVMIILELIYRLLENPEDDS